MSSDVISRDWGRGHKMGYVWCGESIVWDWLFPCSAWDWLILGIRHFGGGVAKYAKYRVLGQKWGFGGGIAKKGSKLPFGGGGIAK